MKIRVFAALLFTASAVYPAVTRVDLVDRIDVLGGESQGTAGTYERIVAKAYFAVDPKLPQNKIIGDIDLAPRNAQGLVEFSADLYILKPRDSAKGNGTALVEISNRGGKGLLSTFDFGTASRDPKTPTEFGDRFLLKQGFTLVWVGWEFDVPASPGVLRLETPIVSDHGKAILGMVRSEWIGDKRVTTIPLGDMAQIGYPVSNQNAPGTELTVRDHIRSERHVIPRNQWSFADETHAEYKAGFEPGKIYEVVYQAKNPVVVGLGPAAVRDAVAFLKHGGAETLLGDQHQYLKRAIGFGISQSGRFLREFLYDGFNQDEKSRPVFDGVWAHVAGAGRGSFNFRFAQPSRDGNPFRNVLYATDVPPFTEDGLLERARKDGVEPKIFLTNGSYEYWGRAASLIHTSPDGKTDVPPDASTRVYFFAGSQHGPGSIPPRKVEAQNLSAANDYRYAQRALLLQMQAWLKDGKEPSPSSYPRVSKDQLVSTGALAFPRVQGVTVPTHKREAYRLDFRSEPPKVGDPFPSFVPQVDQDGNETSGIRMPEIRVPLATNTGWNLRNRAIGGNDEMLSFTGSWIPFPRTRVERENRKDPRQSIEERYPSKRAYLEKITEAIQELVQDGFVLEADVPKLRDRAAAEWDYALTLN
jgi:hypothetical protein